MKVDISCQRLTWALVGFPFPPRDFEKRVLMTKFDYLLNVWKNRDVPEEVTSIFPCVLWIFWKNKNSFLLKKKVYEAENTALNFRKMLDSGLKYISLSWMTRRIGREESMEIVIGVQLLESFSSVM